MGTYKTYLEPKTHSVSKPINRKDMIKNEAGGFAFKADDVLRLRKWLLAGTMTNGFYQSSDELTTENISVVNRLVAIDPMTVAKEILNASNKGINNHTPILALVYLSTGDMTAKMEFKAIFNDVVRTASHLYEFMAYVKSIRGFGKTIHKAVKGWLTGKDLQQLEYQFLKYQQRDGWAGSDVLRMIKPLPRTNSESLLFAWMVGKSEDSLSTFKENGLEKIGVYEGLKRSDDIQESRVVELIDGYRLTHEMIPANITRTKRVWEALFRNMPIGATIRNLGNLTDKGIFDTIANIDILENRMSKENLKRGRIHPLGLASAYKIYAANGSLGRGSLTWKSIPRVKDIMEKGIDDAFEVVEPTNKHFYHAIDISASMTWNSSTGLWLTPSEIAGIMALTTVRSEKNYFVGGFSSEFSELSQFTKTKDFSYCLNNQFAEGKRMGGTNAGAAYEYAIRHNIKTDVFVFWTDNCSWLGSHPTQLLRDYRKNVNSKAKAIYVSLEANRITLVDPSDTKSYDIAGFGMDTIKIIQMIANGEI